MKRILLATVAMGALALGTPASGADLAVKAPPLAPPVYDWSGFYIGGFGGYGFGNQNLNNSTGPAGFADFTTNWETHGPIAGGPAGCEEQQQPIHGDAAAHAQGPDPLEVIFIVPAQREIVLPPDVGPGAVAFETE